VAGLLAAWRGLGGAAAAAGRAVAAVFGGTAEAVRRQRAVGSILVRVLFEQVESLFAFLFHPGLSATNGSAERAIRPAVVNRRVWGGNRTWLGGETQCESRSNETSRAAWPREIAVPGPAPLKRGFNVSLFNPLSRRPASRPTSPPCTNAVNNCSNSRPHLSLYRFPSLGAKISPILRRSGLHERTSNALDRTVTSVQLPLVGIAGMGIASGIDQVSASC